MNIISLVFEAYLKCPTKYFLLGGDCYEWSITFYGRGEGFSRQKGLMKKRYGYWMRADMEEKSGVF